MTISERTTGLRSVLSSSLIYDLLQRALGAARIRRVLVEDFLRPRAGQRVLDIGCGTAEILKFMPPVDYVGFDPNPDYVEKARARAGSGAQIVCDRVSEVSLTQYRPFDLVIALFVLHHLDEAEARQLFTTAVRHLAPGGLLLTADPAFVPGQARTARFLISRDRGAFVRDEAGYRALASASGVSPVESTVRHDLLTVPYSHCILTYRKPGP